MNKWQKDVKQFHQAFNIAAPERVTLPDAHTRMLRCRLLLEETMEFITSCGFRLGHIEKEGRMMMVIAEDPSQPIEPIEQIDGLVDVIYIALGSAVVMGLDLEPFFDEVHRSNMAKLGPDGKPVVRDDGKVLKPEGWEPPNIGRIFLQQRTNSGHEPVDIEVE